ncbi:hypothetical protein AJ87_19365 [Rhizobium yanglingense]|nr:hypothetical protein AJ87_19365 [Rhizobium yanglingense]
MLRTPPGLVFGVLVECFAAPDLADMFRGLRLSAGETSARERIIAPGVVSGAVSPKAARIAAGSGFSS